ncbi:MAG: hypothetical protein HY303_11725 [Candidatus Wallbacteria bacterium]|nr:hypothetical protein [Candidatus Wallbacteria bacterium]
MRGFFRRTREQPAEDEIRLGGLKVFGCNAACPVCGEPAEGEVRTCENCGTPHHADCWDYAGKCALYACEDGIRQPLAGRATPIPSWLDRWLRPARSDRSVSPEGIFMGIVAVVVAVEIVVIVSYSALLRSVEAEIRASNEHKTGPRTTNQARR